jgi:signal peptidase I
MDERQVRRVNRAPGRDGSRDGQRAAVGAPALWRVAVHGIALCATVLTIGLVGLAALPALGGHRPVVVMSDSMEPTIRTGDVVLSAPSDGHGLGVGAVIHHGAAGESTLHRIVEANASAYVTKGDANHAHDSTPVQPHHVEGVGVLLVPFVGQPNVWFHSGQWLQLGLLMAAIVTCFYLARPSWLANGLR